MTSLTLEEIATLLGGDSSERPGPTIDGVRPLEHAGPSDITFLASEKFIKKLIESSAGAVIIPSELDIENIPCVRVKNPEAAFARLTALFYPYARPPIGVSQRADVHSDVNLGSQVSIGPFAVVGQGTEIEDQCVVGAHVVIGDNCHIGSNTWIFPHVTIYSGTTIGRNVIIHAGTVIASDGFGYAPDVDETGIPHVVKKYHSGSVVIEDDVELGSLCAVDRALAGTTRIGRGTKIDNLVQVAHNVHIGEGTVIASQVGIAGSSSVGRFGMIGGQVGVKDHVAVGDRVVLATRVGIYRNVPDDSIMAGSVPAMPHSIFLRAAGLFKRLPEMLDRIRKLEKWVKSRDEETG
jgi:UDP-3-O-[3-hydroxymyristoyl] glucosamine N-acyltransferase